MKHKNHKVIDVGYSPRPFQKWLHRKLKRFNVIAAHRRFGKTVFAIAELVDQSLRCELHNPQFAYIAPTYGAAKRIAWEYIKDSTKNIPGVKHNESELRVEIPRPGREDKIKIMLLGAENPGNLRGIYLDGCIIDEYAECDPTIWSQVIRPALSDRKGWAIFIGTPKGRNHFYDVYHKTIGLDDWFQATLRASQTHVVDAGELLSAQATMSEEEYEQEYEVSWSAALIGAYYGKQLAVLEKDEKLHANVPYDPALMTDTFWDLGIGDTTAIWFVQQFGNEVRLIDYYETSGQDLAHYVGVIKSKNYLYNSHNLPHDAAARDLSTGKTRQETLRKYGLERTYIIPRQNIDDGIHAARMILPRCVFDIKCKRGVMALQNYQRKWDAKNKIFQDKPLHDWASNGSDAFRMLALGLRTPDQIKARRSLPRFAETSYNVFG